MTFAQQMPVGGRMPYAANDQSINVTLLHAARKVGRVEGGEVFFVRISFKNQKSEPGALTMEHLKIKNSQRASRS